MKKYVLVLAKDLPKKFHSVVEEVAAHTVGDTFSNITSGDVEFYISVVKDSLDDIATHPDQKDVIKDHRCDIANAKVLLQFIKQNNIDFIDPVDPTIDPES